MHISFLKVYFGMLDGLLAAEQLPEEYRDRCQVNHSPNPGFILSYTSRIFTIFA
jgi:hypothetical protein